MWNDTFVMLWSEAAGRSGDPHTQKTVRAEVEVFGRMC